VSYLADHSLLLALPAFAPAVVVAAVVAWVAIRDRRNPDPDDENRSEDTD
jgi:membrane protein implicated in regulation of membrane protease activity